MKTIVGQMIVGQMILSPQPWDQITKTFNYNNFGQFLNQEIQVQVGI